MKKRAINFRLLREMIEVREALALLSWPGRQEPSGVWHGPCPFHGSKSSHSRSFGCRREIAHCLNPRCDWRGDAVQLWADLHHLTLLDAAYELCELLRIDPPYLHLKSR